MKKAQAHQVFTYMMAIIVIGAILLLALRVIPNLMGRACEVDEISFKRDIENAISKYSRQGDRGFESIRVPCDYNELWFIDLEYYYEDLDRCDDIDNTAIRTECNAETNNNVFITRGTFTEPLFSIPNIVVQDGITSITPRGNRYHIRIDGVGRGNVRITPDLND